MDSNNVTLPPRICLALNYYFSPRKSSSDKKSTKEKKKGKGILRRGETKSFIPLFREPSSIEKILGEADQLFIRHPTSGEQPKPPPIALGRQGSPRIVSPRTNSRRALSPKASSPRVLSPRVSSPKVQSPRAVSPKAAPTRALTSRATSSKAPPPKVNQIRKDTSHAQKPEPTARDKHLSATKIQAAYRGYLARRSFRALRGLVRLQGVVRGQNVKRQTMNAMKQMQLLVRVQTQIHSRRIQMLENQALQHQAYRNDKEAESSISKWTLNQQFEGGRNEDWDDSVLTKDQVEARSQRKVEAIMKRERAMAYAYSHQLWKANPKSAQSPLDIRSNGYPWWWNWLERQLPASSNSQNQATPKNFSLTPSRPTSDYRASPQLLARNYQETPTPRSSRSAIPIRGKQFQTPGRTPPQATGIKHSKPRSSTANSSYDIRLKDDDSLVSCPPFSVPNYMTPTVSAKAKVRPNSNPKDRSVSGSPGNDLKRRFSFPLTPNIGSFKWNKGFNNDAASQRAPEKHLSSHLLGDAISVDSTISMPATVGRKPFNRFV
ncbi:protein IQ-DOMAIN 14-like [Dorcoceras hygrometricum]|uniref:Protein IQ-DOMAIN 14-like n=1 Tax=Dorcoceras hygrometricum TaxID=472368 RepID=A0A2Z7CUW7_9LAMI|nr:protein IQ-DOMAIN 14-like [Dorcoceras hygrometricum]